MGDIFDQLKKIRVDAGYTEYRTAKSVGIKTDTVKDVEKGKGNVNTINKIAKQFGYELFLKKKDI